MFENKSAKNGLVAVFAIMAMLVVALAPVMAVDADSDNQIYRYTANSKIDTDLTKVKYIVWDFGDGTVLDGRWQFFKNKQTAGDELTEAQAAGVAEYERQLAAAGGSLTQIKHTYAQTGEYTITCVYMNPVGFKYTDNGSEVVFDGQLYQDMSTYDGGLTNATSSDIKTPTDAAIASAEFKAIAGSWVRYTQTFDIMGYPVVTFNSMGGSAVASITVENTSEYAVASMPESNPTKAGYTFKGWYTDEECTQPYDWETLVDHNITLYAGWTASEVPTYDHILKFMDGTTQIDIKTVTNEVNGNVSVQITNIIPQKDGYQFNGWVINAGDEPKTKNDTIMVPVGTTTMNASWTKIDTSITITVDGVQRQMEEGSTLADVTKPTRTGYTFDGWYNNAATTGTKLAETTVLTDGMAIYSKMVQSTIQTISIMVDGNSIHVEAGKKVSDIPKPTQTGYKFDGWYDNFRFTGNKIAETTVLEEGMTLYSKMTKNATTETVKVKIDGKETKFDAGTTVDKIKTPEYEGFTFTGWYDGATKLNDSDVIVADMDIHSSWKANNVKASSEAVTVKADGKTIVVLKDAKVSKLDVFMDGDKWMVVDGEKKTEAGSEDTLKDGMVLVSEDSDNGFLGYLAIALIVIGAMIALIGLFIHPIMLGGGVIVALVGAIMWFI